MRKITTGGGCVSSSEAFACRYAGRRVKVVNYTCDGEHYSKKYNGLIARIIGYDRGYYDRVWLEFLPPVDGKITDDINFVVEPDSVKGSTLRLPPIFLRPEYEMDSCLDCGATEEQPCKDGCPNK
jgi:hypothetical protein